MPQLEMASFDTDDIAAICFDAYGTLIDLGFLTRRCQDRLGARAEAVMALWRQKQLEYTWLRSLMGRFEDFWHVTGESLDYALAQYEINDPALRTDLMQAYLAPEAYADAAPLLDLVRRLKRKSCILSNGSRGMLFSGCKAIGVDDKLDHLLSVDEVGKFKPHPSVYAFAAERLALPASKILMVSANPWDVAGASAFGFRTAWIDRGVAGFDRLPGHPDVILSSLGELGEILTA